MIELDSQTTLKSGLFRCCEARHNDLVTLQRDIARSHLETLIERLIDIEKAVPDPDGDFFIPSQGAGFFARVDGDDVPLIRLFSVIAKNVPSTTGLLEEINKINTQLSFLRAMHIGEQILFEGEMLAMRADLEDFRSICQRIAHASDHFGPRLIEQFGGQPFFETTKTPEYATPAPVIPGYI